MKISNDILDDNTSKKKKTPKKSFSKKSKSERKSFFAGKKKKKQKPVKKLIVNVPTNNRPKLVDEDVMRHHNFLSSTNAMLTEIYRLNKYEGEKSRFNTYISEDKPHHVSAIMKLTLTIMQTNDLSYDWSLILWNISQQNDLLPDECYVTFTRVFERRDNDLVHKKVKRRRILAILSSPNKDNIKRQGKAVSHDEQLINAVDSGDSVVSFGAEAIVTAPDELKLEAAVDAIKNYINANDETRGLTYSLDVGRQNKPFLIFGPDEAAGNKGVYTDMVSYDGGQSALFVDSGGDRSMGSEYIGVSVGKLIRSHAAYNFKNHVSLFVGNDTTENTTTLGGGVEGMSQIYLSKIASRAYLVNGKHVVHFVADDPKSVKSLMDFPLNNNKKVMADASKGLLNMLEAIDDGEVRHEQKDRLLARFPMHINNIITLLSQFRQNGNQVNLADNFSNLARDILIDFFVKNKYWSYTARRNPEDIRLFGYHEKYKTLADFGQYVQERKNAKNYKDDEQRSALLELDTIINRNILPTIPALDTHTKPVIDMLVRAPYRVIDLTGMGAGARSGISNPSLNVMMLSYLNVILPTLNNGDVIMIHGISQMSTIARIVKTMIATSGLNLDVIYTEKNQNNAVSMINATSDVIDQEDDETHQMKHVTKPQALDFTMIDLYHNRCDKLIDAFNMDEEWTKQLSKNRAAYFVKTNDGIDYIYLDKIL